MASPIAHLEQECVDADARDFFVSAGSDLYSDDRKHRKAGSGGMGKRQREVAGHQRLLLRKSKSPHLVSLELVNNTVFVLRSEGLVFYKRSKLPNLIGPHREELAHPFGR